MNLTDTGVFFCKKKFAHLVVGCVCECEFIIDGLKFQHS